MRTVATHVKKVMARLSLHEAHRELIAEIAQLKREFLDEPCDWRLFELRYAVEELREVTRLLKELES